MVDGWGRIVVANRRLAELTGYEPGTLDGRALEVLVPEDQRAQHRRHVREFSAAPVTRPMGGGRPTACRRADGSSVAVDIALAPLPHNPSWTIAVIRDDTVRQQTEAELFRMATHDSLTGLANRALLLDRLEQGLKARVRARTGGRGPLTVLFLDLDRFKAVNDADGHAAGDEVLRVVAAALEHTFRPADTIARVGGDEFVVVCEDTSASDGARLARRALAAVREGVHALPYSAVGGVTASVGVVSTTTDDEDPNALLDRADAAMYAAKRQGGDRLHLA